MVVDEVERTIADDLVGHLGVIENCASRVGRVHRINNMTEQAALRTLPHCLKRLCLQDRRTPFSLCHTVTVNPGVVGYPAEGFSDVCSGSCRPNSWNLKETHSFAPAQ